MAFCPQCGSVLPAGTGACPKCAAGSPISIPSPASGPSGAPGAAGPPWVSVLPQVSPLAIILAAGAWVIGGPLLSIPAIFVARADLRKIREGQLDPSGQTQSQLAFWIAAVNAGLFVLTCFVIGGIFLFAVGFAGVAARAHKPPVPVVATAGTDLSQESDAGLQQIVETWARKKDVGTQKLWRDVKKGLSEAGTAKGTGAMPAVDGFEKLAGAAAGDARVRQALIELERRAAVQSGRTPPDRGPAEAPPGGSRETDDDF